MLFIVLPLINIMGNLRVMLKYLITALITFSTYVEAEACIASYYGPGFHGRRTASGEIFDQNAMTAAHRTLAFGTRVTVTYKGRSVTVRINDRGPFIKGRCIDLSRAAARAIGLSLGDVTLQVRR